MRRLASAVAVVVAALISSAVARADTPPEVYSDYAEDGVLSCGHSRGALKGVLNDASIYQYGDPLTFLGLKLAVRKQLAGGCRRDERSAVPIESTLPGRGESAFTSPPAPQGGARSTTGTRSKASRAAPQRPAGGAKEPPVFDDSVSTDQDGWMVVLGVLLLLVTLGSGGWAARRAFTDES